jgi:hypothetical protein
VPDVYEDRTEVRAYLWRDGIGRLDLPLVEASPTGDHDRSLRIDYVSPDAEIVFAEARCREADQYWEAQDPYTGSWYLEVTRGASVGSPFAWDPVSGVRTLEAFLEDEYGRGADAI